MLVPVAVLALLTTIAAVVVARGALRVLHELGLEPTAVMLWLGLAERPLEMPRKRRRRLGEVLLDAATS